jgi:hypothetical protein
MKRSEMRNLIQKILITEYGKLPFHMDVAQRILNNIENAGMVPPQYHISLGEDEFHGEVTQSSYTIYGDPTWESES